MRRIVRDYVSAAIDRQRPDLETFISEKLVFPASSRRVLAPPLTVRILEARSIKLTPQFGADFPSIDLAIVLHCAIAARTWDRDHDLGERTTIADIALVAVATPASAGYRIMPQAARIVSWWGDLRG